VANDAKRVCRYCLFAFPSFPFSLFPFPLFK